MVQFEMKHHDIIFFPLPLRATLRLLQKPLLLSAPLVGKLDLSYVLHFSCGYYTISSTASLAVNQVLC